MTPVRLLILAILFYIGYRLLKGLGQDRKVQQAGAKGREEEKEETRVEDILVEDPVCHTLVPKSQSIRLRMDDETYYFCSETCCDTFTGKSEEKT